MADKVNKLTGILSFQEEIRKCFFYLFSDFGFEFIAFKDYQGNVLVAQSGDLRFRFIRDRVDFFLDIGYSSRPEEWISFYKILEKFKRNGKINDDYKISNKAHPVSTLLHKYLPLIIEDAREGV